MINPPVKAAAVVRGGILGGVLVAGVITVAGSLLEINVAPWSWAAATPGYLGRVIEFTRRIGILLPFSIAAGIAIAVACALLFEYVTKAASAIAGAIVGLVVGMLTASALGLIPWLAFWLSYTYMPVVAPLGPHNASWVWLALMAAGTAAGIIAGVTYGEIIHRPRVPRPVRYRQIHPMR